MSADVLAAPPRPHPAPAVPPKSARRTATARLRDALMSLGDWRGQILTHGERPWASITFSGTSHSLALLFAGDEAVAAGERFVEALGEHEFSIPGQLVADAAIVEVEHRLVPTPRLVVQCRMLLLREAD